MSFQIVYDPMRRTVLASGGRGVCVLSGCIAHQTLLKVMSIKPKERAFKGPVMEGAEGIWWGHEIILADLGGPRLSV